MAITLFDDLMLTERALVCSDGEFPLAFSAAVPTSGDEIWQILISGNTAYVFTYADTGHLRIYDITEVMAPTLSSSIALSGVDAASRPFKGPLAAVVKSGYVYIAGMSGHLMIVDATTPTAPVVKSVYAPFTGAAPYPIARAIAVSEDGTMVYLSNSSTAAPARDTFIQVINTTNKASPVLATNIDMGPYGDGAEIIYDMKQCRGNLYVAGQYSDGVHAGTLSIYSLTTPALPTALSVTRFEAMLGYMSVSATGNYVYVNDTASPCHTFIMDVTNKRTPVILSTITHDVGIVSADPKGIDSLCDDLLYFFPEGAGNNWVDVYKVTDKVSPSKIKRFKVLGGSGISGCGTADAKGLFVANRAGSSMDIFVPPLATYINGGGGSGGGNVRGPTVSEEGAVAVFSGTTGHYIRMDGLRADALGLLTQYGTDNTAGDGWNQQSNGFRSDASAGCDTNFIHSINGDDRWATQTFRDENGQFWYLYSVAARSNPLTVSDGGRVGVNKTTNVINYHTRYMDPTLGASDDMDAGGVYTRPFNTLYEVSIASTGTPDMFTHRYSLDNGATWSGYATPQDCSLTPVALDAYGATAMFESVTGHNTHDAWQFIAFAQLPDGTLTIAPTMFDEVNTTTDYTVASPEWSDVSFNVATAAGPATTVLPIGAGGTTKGAIYIGSSRMFNYVTMDIVTAAINASLVIEYWNGAWTMITGAMNLNDGTNALTVAGSLAWDKSLLTGWTKNLLAGKDPSDTGYNLYWVRIRSSTLLATEPTTNLLTPQSNTRLAIYQGFLDGSPSYIVNGQGEIYQYKKSSNNAAYNLINSDAVGQRINFRVDPGSASVDVYSGGYDANHLTSLRPREVRFGTLGSDGAIRHMFGQGLNFYNNNTSLLFSMSANGKLTAGVAGYEALVANDNDIPNKKYVDGLGGGIKLQSGWNANTNVPDISATTTVGYAWNVTVAGSTDLGGIATWSVGDLAVKTASGWSKIGATPLVWGNITGTIAAQGDLQGALDAKVNSSTLATWAGTSYITTLGTIDSGTWHGATINKTYLDTTLTAQGNSFNGALQLLQMDAAGKYPAIDGSQITKIGVVGTDNLALGAGALAARTTGTANTAIGYGALANVATGTNNIALGAYAGKYETGSNAFYVDNQDRTNTAGDKTGALLYGTFSATPSAQTLVVNGVLTATYGMSNPMIAADHGNEFFGAGTGNLTMTGSGNVGLGYQTLRALTTGSNNNALGWQALLKVTTGLNNCAFGWSSLGNVTTGSGNCAYGYRTLINTTTGGGNTGYGTQTLYSNTIGASNTAMGENALTYGQASNYNTAIGSGAMFHGSSGSYNTAVGMYALSGDVPSGITGHNSTAVGYNALASVSSGGFNTAVGSNALSSQLTGTNCVAIGYCAGKYETGSNAFYINNQDRTDLAGSRTKSLMYGVFDAAVANQYLTINANQTINGLLTVQSSSAATDAPTLASEFLAGGTWTSTNWSGDNVTGWVHTTGNTSPLSYSKSATLSRIYYITYTITGRTNGTVTATLGGLTIANGVIASGTTSIRATNTDNLVIIPTSLFDGTIVFSIKAVTAASTAFITYKAADGTLRSETRSSASATNMFWGSGAGGNTLTGVNNSAFGNVALLSNVTGNSNSAFGYSSLNANISGGSNTAIGTLAMSMNTTGSNNTSVGFGSLSNNSSGINNTTLGAGAMYTNTTGGSNVAVGKDALSANDSGVNNTAVGTSSLYYNTMGTANVAVGMGAMMNSITAVATLGTIVPGSGYVDGTYTNVQLTRSSGSIANSYPTANITVTSGGVTAVTLLTYGRGYTDSTTVFTAANTSLGGTGSGFTVPIATLLSAVNNTAVGYNAFTANLTGVSSVAVGYTALASNTVGFRNVAVGAVSLTANTTGNYNAALGYFTLNGNITGSNNVAVGSQALAVSTNSSNNTAVGYTALQSSTSIVSTLGAITGGSGYSDGTFNAVQLVWKSGSIASTYPTANIVVSGGSVTSVTLVTFGSRFIDTTTVLTTTALSGGTGFSVPVATLSTGSGNTAVGSGACSSLTTGGNNVAVGASSLYAVTSGGSNIAIGPSAMVGMLTGIANIAIGGSSLAGNTAGYNNLAIGAGALAVALGTGNIAIGNTAGKYEVGSNSFYLNNYDQANTAGDKAYSLLYGTFAGAAGVLTNQQLTVNGALTVNTGSFTTSAGAFHYFGTSTVDGTWRIGRSGNDLVFERRESGNYVTKYTLPAA